MKTGITENLLSSTSAQLQSNPFVRWIANIVWLSIAALCVSLFFVDTALDYSQITIPCEGEWAFRDASCNFLAISSVESDVLTSWGLSLEHYATFMMLEPILVSIGYLALGFLILWQKGRSLIGLTVSLALVTIPYSTFSSEVQWETIHPDLAILGFVASSVTNITTMTFFYLLPNGRFSPKWAFFPYISLLLISIVGLLSNYINLNISDTLLAFLFSLYALNVPLIVIFQIYRYFRDSSSVEKQQTKLILVGILSYAAAVILWIISFSGAVSIPAGMPRLLINLIGTFVSIFLLLGLPIAITIAIFRYRLWNIDVAINRTLVNLAVTAVLAIVFIVTAFIVQSILNAENQLIGFVVSAIGPALLFNPTRKRVRHFIDRRIYGFAFDLNELDAAQQVAKITHSGKLSGITLGDYLVLDVIGKGGMGEVYKGQGNGETVAIKTMLADIASDMSMRTRFIREAEIGRTLDHPNIAKVYTNGDYDGTPYLIMEYIDGADISQQLKAGETYDIETAITMMQQVCDALDTAHAQGYVHRDIKPANMVQRSNGALVLMDFGITKVENASVALTGTGAIGTISYMSPEQIMAAKDVDHRADIYALGVVLYELLTGQLPFDGSPAQVLFAHLQQPTPDPCDIDSSIPTDMGDVILKALEKDPD